MVTTPADLNIKDDIQRHRALASLSDTEEIRQRISLIVSLVVIIIMAAQVITALAIRSTQASALTTEQRKLADLESQLQAADHVRLEKNLINLSRGVKTLRQKLESKVDYGRFWSLIQDSQVKDVVYTALATDDKGNVRLDAQAPGYEKVAKQLQALRQPDCQAVGLATKTACFSQVELTALTKEESGIKFGISLILDPKIIKK